MTKFRFYRHLKELIQYQVAAKANINPTVLSLIENGHREPTGDEAKKIANALEVDVGLLWPELKE